jgi:hypothetical protein
MHGTQFASQVNAQYFGGRLSREVIDRLAVLPMNREDVRAFVERMCRSTCTAGFPVARRLPEVALCAMYAWAGERDRARALWRDVAAEMRAVRSCGSGRPSTTNRIASSAASVSPRKMPRPRRISAKGTATRCPCSHRLS